MTMLGLDDAGAAGTVFTGVLLYPVVLVVIGQAARFLSDRLGRREILVFASTVLWPRTLACSTSPTPARSAWPRSLGAALIGGAATNYHLLYISAAALTFLGALAIVPVKKVK